MYAMQVRVEGIYVLVSCWCGFMINLRWEKVCDDDVGVIVGIYNNEYYLWIGKNDKSAVIYLYVRHIEREVMDTHAN